MVSDRDNEREGDDSKGSVPQKEGKKHDLLRNKSQRSKAKGKAKIVEEDVDTMSEENNATLKLPVLFVIKFSDNSLQDLTLHVEDIMNSSVSSLKKEIRKNVGGITTNRRLRLIHGGRIINDQTDLAKDVAKVKLSDRVNNAKSPESIPKVYIHCSIGDIFTPEEMARENEYDSKTPVQSTLPELRGFDRLRATGFTEDDIAQLRQQFTALYGTSGQQNPEEVARMEDQWIDTGVGDGAAGDVVLGGDYLDDLLGILTGMFLGVFALLFLKESSLFSNRQQKAVVAGVAVNFSFALLRLLM
ncbi:hypothetical protein TRICI_004608 [Trichomonascus ciferrii]|uniref:Ubiquitin-like domain-containing protein n=1 Tax=Trichomonascus ciferrii TaxID=44093 RepID=A0A642UZW3_9ASCO|nr:hypothetical protein TRICI_004608 [Trichomonascus ciferrii]